MLFHDEELGEEELKKYFEKLDPETIELIKQEYEKQTLVFTYLDENFFAFTRIVLIYCSSFVALFLETSI